MYVVLILCLLSFINHYYFKKSKNIFLRMRFQNEHILMWNNKWLTTSSISLNIIRNSTSSALLLLILLISVITYTVRNKILTQAFHNKIKTINKYVWIFVLIFLKYRINQWYSSIVNLAVFVILYLNFKILCK